VSHLILLAQAAGGGGASMILIFVAMFAIMYFMIIRPQQKQVKQHNAMLASLKKGDEVVTQGGVIGRITVIADKVITLEIASGVKVRVLKGSVQSRAAALDDAAKADDKKAEEKEEKS
jgi:preprotein translocase subunit YajC